MSRKNRIALVVAVWGIACIGIGPQSSPSSFVDARKPEDPYAPAKCIRCSKPAVMAYLSDDGSTDAVHYCSKCVLMRNSMPNGVQR